MNTKEKTGLGRENRVGKRKQGWEEKTRKIKNFDKTLEN